MMGAAEDKSLLNTLLKTVWSAVAIGCVLALWAAVSRPAITPLMPAQSGLAPNDIDSPSAVLGHGSRDFVARPLFLEGRRPLAIAANAPVAAVPNSEEPEPAKPITGVALLGIFSSSGSTGIIVSDKRDGQYRLFQGEKLGDWTLTAIEPRAAVFTDGQSTTRLEMKLLSELPTPVVVDTSGDESGSEDGVNRAASVAASKGETRVLSFDNLYRPKADPRAATGQSESIQQSADNADTGSVDNNE